MLEFKRRVTVETEAPSDNNVSGVVSVNQEWLIDELPISLCLHGSRHIMFAKDVRLEHIIDEPETPTADRNVLVFTSADGRKIDTVKFYQTWSISREHRRHFGQSFPVENYFTLPEDASIVELLAVTLPEADGCTSTIPLKDYLELKRERTEG